MPYSDDVLEVNGTELYHEVRGAGPQTRAQPLVPPRPGVAPRATFPPCPGRLITVGFCPTAVPAAAITLETFGREIPKV